MPTRKLFWFTGLWQPGEVLILTGSATGFLRSIHDRQPVVLPEKELGWWLNPDAEETREGWAVIRRGVNIAAFEAFPVTPQMSSPRFESPECVRPIALAQSDLFKRDIDDVQCQRRELSDSPPLNTTVDLLMEDDDVTSGQYDGKKWFNILRQNSPPVRWRSQKWFRDAIT